MLSASDLLAQSASQIQSTSQASVVPLGKILENGSTAQKWLTQDQQTPIQVQDDRGNTYLQFPRLIETDGVPPSIRYTIPADAQSFSRFQHLSLELHSSPETTLLLYLEDLAGQQWQYKKDLQLGLSAKNSHISLTESEFIAVDTSSATNIPLNKIAKLILRPKFPDNGFQLSLDNVRLHGPSAENQGGLASIGGQISDSTAPSITEITLDETPIVEGDFANRDSLISATLRDADPGISTWSIQIIDANTLNEIQHFTSSANLETELIASLNMALTADGQFKAVITAIDQDGLSSVATSSMFEVVSVFKVRGFLNGPNPFNPYQEVTHFQYSLTHDANIELYVYSISGEQQWSYKANAGSEGGSTGFNSLIWNGRNQFDEVVANAPYIAYLVAQSNGKKIIKKTKVLVLK